MMSKLKTWFYVFKRSLTDPSYYNEVKKLRFSFSLKYLYLLLVFALLITGIQFAVPIFKFLPSMPAKVNEVRQSLAEDYPEGLEVKIDKGILTTNATQPVYINFPKTSSALGIKEDINFITIDTNARVEDFVSYETAVLMTQNSIVYQDNSTYRVQPLAQFKDPVEINQEVYLTLLKNIDPFLKSLPTILTAIAVTAIVIFPILGAGSVLLGKLLYLLIMTLVILLIAKLMKKNYNYSTLYRLGIHGLTLPIVLTFLLGLFDIHLTWLYTGIFIAWMGVVLNKIK